MEDKSVGKHSISETHYNKHRVPGVMMPRGTFPKTPSTVTGTNHLSRWYSAWSKRIQLSRGRCYRFRREAGCTLRVSFSSGGWDIGIWGVAKVRLETKQAGLCHYGGFKTPSKMHMWGVEISTNLLSAHTVHQISKYSASIQWLVDRIIMLSFILRKDLSSLRPLVL